MKKLKRGHTFRKAITAAISPIHVTAIIIAELDEISRATARTNSAPGQTAAPDPIAAQRRQDNPERAKSLRGRLILDLKQQRMKRGEINQRQRSQKNPSRSHLSSRAAMPVEEPPECVINLLRRISRTEYRLAGDQPYGKLPVTFLRLARITASGIVKFLRCKKR